MGVVYRATHLLLERTVALKLIAPSLASNPAFRSRFEREWRLLAALDHPNVIDIYEAGEYEGRPYLCMRWVEGGDLAQRLRGTTGLEPKVALDILGQVAAALDAAHERGVVHRDIKPANILLDDERVWLTDFGAGKDLEGRDTRTATGQWVGTVDYVAPELLDAQDRDAAVGRLLARLRALRGAHRPRPVRARERRRDAVGAPLPAAAEVLRGARRAAERARRRAPAGAGQGARRAPGERRRADPGGARGDRRAAVREADAGRRLPLRRRAAACRSPPPRSPPCCCWPAGSRPALLLGGGDVKTRPRRATKLKAPFVEKIDLGENVTTGAVAVGTSWVFVGDGPNRRGDRRHPELAQGLQADQAARAAARHGPHEQRRPPVGRARGRLGRGHPSSTGGR